MQIRRFGSFGPLGKHFGITGRITVGDDDYSLEQDVYDDLCRKVTREVLKNSAKTLLLIKKNGAPLLIWQRLPVVTLPPSRQEMTRT